MRVFITCRRALLFCVFCAVAIAATAQSVETGLYSFGSFDTLGFDSIDRGSLNVHFAIPVISKVGRGIPFAYSIDYDGLVWSPAGVSGSQTWTPSSTWGFYGQFGEGLAGYLTNTQQTIKCVVQTDGAPKITTVTFLKNFNYHDPFGRAHRFNYTVSYCPDANGDSPVVGGDGTAYDSSGYVYNGSTVRAPNGAVISVPLNNTSGAASITDLNGNTITSTGTSFTDTVGVTALALSGSATPASPQVFTYKTTTGTGSVVVSYKSYSVKTAFGCSGVGEYSQTASLVDRITFADSSYYAFTYESTPGNSASVTGRIASVQLPQGGVISYQYTGGSNGITCTDGTTAGIIRTTSDGTRTYVRSSTTSTTSQTSITDGMSNPSTSVWSFVIAGTPAEYYETQRVIYQGSASGTPLLSRLTCYNGNTASCPTTVPTLPIGSIDTYDTFDGIQTNGTTTIYNSYGYRTGQNVWDFATSGSRGSRLSYEKLTYGTSIAGLLTEDDVYDGGYTLTTAAQHLASETQYGYDETTPQASTGVPQHIAESGARGNLTSVSQYANASAAYKTTMTYEDTGSILTATTPNGTATASYDSTFTYQTGTNMPMPSSGVAISYTIGYDTSKTGLPLTSYDPNSQPTTISAANYDSMLRLTHIGYPDGGATDFTYTSPNEVEVTATQSSSASTITIKQLDGYGRQSRTFLTNGQSTNPYYQRDTCYDSDGRTSFVSYTYQGSGIGSAEVCSGAGDSYQYDALGRVTLIAHANGETDQYVYLGHSTKHIDANGAITIVQTDGLNRPTAVCEVSSSTLQNVAPVACGMDITATGFLTTYAYNLVAHTTTVTQGAQTRTFQTDWLGRAISVTEPESGSTTYSYAYNSTGLVVTRKRPKANQTSSSTLTTTTTQYDSLGRVISISYDDGTPTKTFTYDASANWSSLSQTNLKGRLSTASVSNASSVMSYDSVGRVTVLAECLPSGCGTHSYDKVQNYTYDLAGNVLTSTDGGGVTSTYTVSAANEVLSLTSSQSNTTNPSGVLSSVVNGPNGPASYGLGNGLSGAYSYDTLGRLNGGWICSGSTSTGCSGGTQTYGYTAGWKGVRLTGSSDSVLNQGSTYGYDEFNRLTSRAVNAGTVQNFNYTYDRYGNRWQQNITAGSGPSPQFSFNASTNQLSTGGYAYDAAGNMTNDSYHTYAYDAEGNITQVDSGSTAQYVYNALNQRVKTVVGSTATEFVFNANGQRVSVWNGTTRSQLRGQYYWGSKPVAYYSGGSTHFQHQDWIGTERLRTTYNGAVEGTFTSLPFGDSQTTLGTDGDAYHYAMLDLDSEDNTNHAQFRQYSSTQGRWLSPDPYSGSYDFSNPQSLNRYTYSSNLPLTFVDPLGTSIEVVGNCRYEWVYYYVDGVFDSAKRFLIDCDNEETGPGPSLGGGAPNKNIFGVTPKQKQDCLNAWNNSALGKGVQFFSLYNLATNLSSLKTWAEWTVLPAAKIGAFAVLSKMSSAIGGTELSSVVAGTTTTVTAAPVASGVATAESLGASVAPYGIAAATVLDMNASAGCSGMQSNYFSSGQVGVF